VEHREHESRIFGKPVGRLVRYERPPFTNYWLVSLRTMGAAPKFDLVETLVTYFYTGKAVDKPVHRVERAGAKMADACAEIARQSFTFDRFHADKRIPKALADELKADWTRQLLNGGHQASFVAFVGDTPAGYVSLLDNAIELIAVAPEFQGIGVGSSLTAAAILAGAKRVGTQKNNAPSRACYERLGFEKRGEVNTYHWINNGNISGAGALKAA